jgi:hypothetical protein
MKRLVSIVLLSGMVMGSLGTLAVRADDETAPAQQSGGKHHGGLKKACGDEIQKFCSDKKGKEIGQCLKAQDQSTLSQGCQDAVKKMGQHKPKNNTSGTPPQSGQ